MKALVVGIGGGGDVAAAYCVARHLQTLGYETTLGSIVWERLVRDPLPGPISVDELRNCEKRGNYCVADGDEFAVRKGVEVVPQASKLAKAAGLKVLIFDLKGGWRSLYEGLKQALEDVGADLVVAVDAGGDVLAVPEDEEVWSPLADALGLAALKSLEGVEKWLAVYGPGCDGELPPQKVLERVAGVWKRGGNEGGFVISRKLAEECLEIVKKMDTEASLMALLAALGEYGPKTIRRGARRLELSPITATTFFLDADKVETPLAKAVLGTSSVEKASERLNELCVYTELDLERDLVSGGNDVVKVREEGRRKVMERCRPARGP